MESCLRRHLAGSLSPGGSLADPPGGQRRGGRGGGWQYIVMSTVSHDYMMVIT